MQMHFKAEPDPDEDLSREIQERNPTNPFFTLSYRNSMSRWGYQPWALMLVADHDAVLSCFAFMKTGRLERVLTIESLPLLDTSNSDLFWEGIYGLCLNNRVSRLIINSYASRNVSIPNLQGEISRRRRWEYVFDLQNIDLWKLLRKSHRSRLNRAKKEGVRVVQAMDKESCEYHARVIAASHDRRKGRGELMPESSGSGMYYDLVSSGAATLYQALLDEEVVSSILVLRSSAGAYTHSSGTNSRGMQIGAAHYLRYELSRMLQEQRIAYFNMGGVDDPASGLAQYKSGFGGDSVELEAAEFFFGSSLRRKLLTGIRLIRNDPFRLLRALTGRIERYAAYSALARDIPVPSMRENLQLRKLADDELRDLATRKDEFYHHALRFEKEGFNSAYGVYCEGKLAHISWLVMRDHDETLRIRNVRLRSDEAEITHCYTLPRFRRMGLYSFAIRRLAEIAAMSGLRRVFMLAYVKNVPSRKGIECAGLRPCWGVVRYVTNLLPEERSVTIRLHRLYLLFRRRR